MPVKQCWDLGGSKTPVNSRSWGQIYFVDCLLFIRQFALLVQMRIPWLHICTASQRGRLKGDLNEAFYQRRRVTVFRTLIFWTSSSLCRLFYDSGYLTLAALSMENFPPSLPSYSKYHIFPCKLTLGTLIKISNRMFLMFISRNGVWKKLMLSPKAL